MEQGIFFITGSSVEPQNNTIGIYTIESPTGAVYVGQSWRMKDRWRKYKKSDCKKQPKIYNSLKKHGPENHSFKIQMYFSENTLQSVIDKYEDDYINLFKNNGFEVMNLRGGGSRGKLSPETIAKLKGRTLSEDQISRMKIYRARQVFSIEDRQKISAGLKKYNESIGRKPKPEIKYPRVDGKFSEEQRKLYSEGRKGENGYFYGKKHSEETKKLFSEYAKNRTGTKNGRAQPVIQYDLDMNFIKEWDFINQAASELNISRHSINNVINGWRKTGHGFIWRRKNND